MQCTRVAAKPSILTRAVCDEAARVGSYAMAVGNRPTVVGAQPKKVRVEIRAFVFPAVGTLHVFPSPLPAFVQDKAVCFLRGCRRVATIAALRAKACPNGLSKTQEAWTILI